MPLLSKRFELVPSEEDTNARGTEGHGLNWVGSAARLGGKIKFLGVTGATNEIVGAGLKKRGRPDINDERMINTEN